MKLSRQQIQQIVKENILDWFSMPKMIPDEERYEMLLDKAHEYELDRDIARAEQLALAGDFEAAIQELMQGITAVNESTHRSQKLSKLQLKRIIKEEKAKLVEISAEQAARINAEQSALQSQANISRELGELHDAIDRLIGVMGRDEVAAELEGIAEEIRMGMV